MRANILFLASTPDVGRAIASMLESNRFRVARSDDHETAVHRLAAEHFDLLVIEVKVSAEDSGLRFLRHLHASSPHLTPRVVVISADPPPSVQRELDAIGICDMILKPVHEEEILSAVLECLDRTPSSVH